ncbi:efflux RND transporter periplasmic adaptor subunit [Candidatus Uabimicrobium amorphum]|uniref:Secretion protein HlyD n=1 Tax=Uabimicrobium amorphum TaxID=2596890 RepID=A0A5S9F358_UABAM|nr:efflux RND transporter periplasmic adaptor subunit [Candidatus Uabimicrobium amorphum]BBM84395.1 secretion protein HlyD [Candidatus Uabimicrobium amorphum]
MRIYILIILFIIACEKGKTPHKNEEIRSVTVYNVQTKMIDDNLPFRGFAHPYRTAKLSFRIRETIHTIHYREGATIKKEQVIASLEDKNLNLQLVQAQKALRLVQSKLKEISLGPRTEEVAIAKMKIEMLKDVYNNKLFTLQTKKKLRERNVVSVLELDGLKTQATVALEDRKIAEQQLEILQQGAREETIQLVRDEVALAKTRVDLAKLNLSYTKLHAPFSGTIHEVNVEEGEFYSGAQPAFVIDDLHKVKVKIFIPESQIGVLKVGQKAQVSFSALTDKAFQGTLSRIAHKTDPTSKTFLGEILIENKGGLIRAGMFSNVSIILKRKKKVLSLPPELIFKDKLGFYVLTLQQRQQKLYVARKNVTVGSIIDNAIIVHGLKENDRVLENGRYYVLVGDEVKRKN